MSKINSKHKGLFWAKIGSKYVSYVLSKPGQTVKSLYGPLLKRNDNDQTFRFCLGAEYGFYFSNFLNNYRKNYILIDIGANLGIYSLVAGLSRKCKRIVSFEPVKRTFEDLRDNIRLNNLEDKVMAKNCAISDITGTTKISVNSHHSGIATLRKLELDNFDHYEDIETIDFSILNQIVVVDDTDKIVVKIDTEGFELVIIKQLMKTAFWNNVQYIYCEISENWFDSNEILEILKKEFIEISRSQININKQYDVLMKRK